MRFPRGWVCPVRCGIRGCIPAVVNRTVGSFSGIRDDEGISLCFLDLKKSMYSFIRAWRVFSVIKRDRG